MKSLPITSIVVIRNPFIKSLSLNFTGDDLPFHSIQQNLTNVRTCLSHTVITAPWLLRMPGFPCETCMTHETTQQIKPGHGEIYIWSAVVVDWHCFFVAVTMSHTRIGEPWLCLTMPAADLSVILPVPSPPAACRSKEPPRVQRPLCHRQQEHCGGKVWHSLWEWGVEVWHKRPSPFVHDRQCHVEDLRAIVWRVQHNDWGCWAIHSTKHYAEGYCSRGWETMPSNLCLSQAPALVWIIIKWWVQCIDALAMVLSECDYEAEFSSGKFKIERTEASSDGWFWLLHPCIFWSCDIETSIYGSCIVGQDSFKSIRLTFDRKC